MSTRFSDCANGALVAFLAGPEIQAQDSIIQDSIIRTQTELLGTQSPSPCLRPFWFEGSSGRWGMLYSRSLTTLAD